MPAHPTVNVDISLYPVPLAAAGALDVANCFLTLSATFVIQQPSDLLTVGPATSYEMIRIGPGLGSRGLPFNILDHKKKSIPRDSFTC